MSVIESIKNVSYKVTDFYIQGLRSMTLGKTLWKIIAVKLFIILFVFKLFFFPDILKKTYKTDTQRSQHVLEALTSHHSMTLSNIQGNSTILKNSYFRR